MLGTAKVFKLVFALRSDLCENSTLLHIHWNLYLKAHPYPANRFHSRIRVNIFLYPKQSRCLRHLSRIPLAKLVRNTNGFSWSQLHLERVQHRHLERVRIDIIKKYPVSYYEDQYQHCIISFMPGEFLDWQVLFGLFILFEIT